MKYKGCPNRKNLTTGSFKYKDEKMRHSAKGKTTKNMGKRRLQLEAFKFPSFEADSNNSALKDCPQNTENWVLSACLPE